MTRNLLEQEAGFYIRNLAVGKDFMFANIRRKEGKVCQSAYELIFFLFTIILITIKSIL